MIANEWKTRCWIGLDWFGLVWFGFWFLVFGLDCWCFWHVVRCVCCCRWFNKKKKKRILFNNGEIIEREEINHIYQKQLSCFWLRSSNLFFSGYNSTLVNLTTQLNFNQRKKREKRKERREERENERWIRVEKRRETGRELKRDIFFFLTVRGLPLLSLSFLALGAEQHPSELIFNSVFLNSIRVE